MTDEPDGEVVAAVEVEAGEAVELAQELIAQALSIVEDDDGDDAAFVDEGHERLLDVGDDLRAWAGAQTEFDGQHAIEVEWFDGAVGQVDDAVLAGRQCAAEVAHRGALADAGFAGDDADPRLGGEPGEGARERATMAGAVGEEVDRLGDADAEAVDEDRRRRQRLAAHGPVPAP